MLSVQKALLRTFESSGFEVTIASDGATAMQTFAATSPKVVLLDLASAGKVRAGPVPRDPETIERPDPGFERRQRCCRQGAAAGTRRRRLCDQALQPAGTAWRACASPLRRLTQGAEKQEVYQLRRDRGEFRQDGAAARRPADPADAAGVQDAAVFPEQQRAGRLTE